MSNRRRALEVVATGPSALIQDRGRPGYADVGVGRSGAADRRSFGLGARLLAQDESCAAIEVTFGGLGLRARGDLLVALTGAPAPAVVRTVDGHEWAVGYDGPFVLGDGETLTLGNPTAGLRTYVSVRGGIDVDPELGSRSTDTLSGLGPPVLSMGDALPVGRPPGGFPVIEVAPTPVIDNNPMTLRALWGPRNDWLADPAELTSVSWTVSEHSDRVGVRLTGRKLRRHATYADAELPSEGVVRGAIQVPAGGEPVLFLADHPVTGGYPVVGVIRTVDVDRLAQAVPGQIVRLVLA